MSPMAIGGGLKPLGPNEVGTTESYYEIHTPTKQTSSSAHRLTANKCPVCTMSLLCTVVLKMHPYATVPA